MPIYWNSQPLVRRVTGNVLRGMEKAGAYFTGAARKNVSTGQPYKRYKGATKIYYKGLDPSKPGDAFPKLLTGQLRRSITWKTGPEPSVTMGSFLGYAGFLETKPPLAGGRPWLSATWFIERDNVVRIILGG